MRLIIMACSATKCATPTPMAALFRYNGPMWQTLRAQLVRLPDAATDYATGDLRIWVLSALYGFVPASTEIPDYDRRMTPDLAAKMARDPSYDFQHIAHMVEDADDVLFAGGEMYRDAMWRASGGHLHNIMKIAETDGRGIGEHRAQLAAWLDGHYQRMAA